MSIIPKRATGERTPGTPDRCEYLADGFARCKGRAVGELRGHTMGRPDRLPWSLCEVHLKPEAQPRDLWGKLVTWAR